MTNTPRTCSDCAWSDCPPCVRGVYQPQSFEHADVAVPGNCGPCADTRKANAARPVLSLVSNRPDWCGECDEWTRLRDYDGTPYRCPTCHPLAEEESA